MDFSLPADLWTSVVPIAAAVGAVGGFGWDVGNAIRASSKEPTTGLDNVIELPHGFEKTGGGYAVDLGFLGPMIVGALAGVLLVLLVGPSAPNAEEAAKALLTANTTAVSTQPPPNGSGPQGEGAEAATPAEATQAVEEQLPSSIPEA